MFIELKFIQKYDIHKLKSYLDFEFCTWMLNIKIK